MTIRRRYMRINRIRSPYRINERTLRATPKTITFARKITRILGLRYGSDWQKVVFPK